jgi:hypothetical protein
MGANEFLDMVGNNLTKIKNCFKKGLSKIDVNFDEDVFFDTMLKCYDKFNGLSMNDETAMHYFWVSFKNNSIKKDNEINRYNELSDDYNNIPDITYNEHIDIIYDVIYDEISNIYGAEICDLWFMHILCGKTYEELEKISNIDNLHYIFRKIREHIRTKLPKTNQLFNEIIQDYI